MQKCAVCKQHILPSDRTVTIDGKIVHAEVCARYMEERTQISESTGGFDVEEIELL
ncbi:hypothetical protein phiAS5_ORF0041 [Aeromonas phage phiAS5]|uniref:Uncharacterized protein n=1 Tax=Aeromonas phage phiAS5 TaxID=879630 RepID=E1A2D8_9CAUD|nr:hypothetical protein phiAS5_ORF0041 [Aeromonas phage phiAS5]ADM79884.1 hypothetical protein phiAS5_ORF0041 [Aeromonas phage phiAS5]BES53010.1 hypothetical protein [Aeromonas phage phiWae14]